MGMNDNTGTSRYSDDRVKTLLTAAYARLPEPDPARLAAMEARLLAGLPRRRQSRTWQWSGLLLLGVGGLAAAWWSAPLWWPAPPSDTPAVTATPVPAPAPKTKISPVPAAEQAAANPVPQSKPENTPRGERKRSPVIYRKEEY